MNRSRTSWFELHAPEIGGTLHRFHQQCVEDGVLDHKTKALLMLALSTLLHNRKHAEHYLKQARLAGATKEEVTETLLAVVSETSDAQLDWADTVCSDYLRGRGDRNVSCDGLGSENDHANHNC